MNFLKRWYLRRKIRAALEKTSPAEEQLDLALKESNDKLIRATREAQKRNKLIEAERRVRNIEDAQNKGFELLEGEDDSDDKDDSDDLFKTIFLPMILQKLKGGATPATAPFGEFPQNSQPPALPQQTPQEIGGLKALAIEKINAMSDDELLKVAERLK